MIYDCFLYNGEKDLLDIRVSEMSGLDVKHLVFQSSHTFKGDLKAEELLQYPWNDRVEFNTFRPNMIDPDPWVNEKKLRNGIVESGGLLRAKPDDIIIISDVDEIPRKEAILQFKPEMEVAFLDMQKFGFFLNLREGLHWTPPKIMTWSHLKTTTPEAVRNAGAPHTIDNAGWHFSWCGGIDEVMRKFASFSHQEEVVQRHANREELMRKMKVGESIWGSDSWSPVPISELPQYIQDHQHDSLKHLIFKP